MSYKINKELCIGCGSCQASCPEGIELENEGKAKITDERKLEECGGENLCPFGAIIKEEK